MNECGICKNKIDINRNYCPYCRHTLKINLCEKNLQLDENQMVILNEHNSKIVEDAISSDNNYNQNKGLESFNNIKDKNNPTFKEIKLIIDNISSENSTRTDNESKNAITEYIININFHFFEDLKQGNIELVDKILNYLKTKKCSKQKSLASKVVKYLDEWFYKKNDFTINDSVVRNVLPYYAYKYLNQDLLNTNLDNFSYVNFFKICKEIKEKNQNLTLNQIDHILWYSYKNDPLIKNDVNTYLKNVKNQVRKDFDNVQNVLPKINNRNNLKKLLDDYINKKFDESISKGSYNIILKCKDIQDELNLKDVVCSICGAMRRATKRVKSFKILQKSRNGKENTTRYQISYNLK